MTACKNCGKETRVFIEGIDEHGKTIAIEEELDTCMKCRGWMTCSYVNVNDDFETESWITIYPRPPMFRDFIESLGGVMLMDKNGSSIYPDGLPEIGVAVCVICRKDLSECECE